MTTPITILTGFVGSGKTTLILNLLPQLTPKGYKLSLIKNEIGDVAVDSALALASSVAATKELLGDCICCTNVGQIESALEALVNEENKPDRVVIETSGSAEPLKLVLEIRRIIADHKENGGTDYELDGVVSVIDAQNWGGYADKSFTARLQAKQTDLIVINKWEGLNERQMDLFLDKLGDLEVDTPRVKSDKGKVSADILFGIDSKLGLGSVENGEHEHNKGEVECISVTGEKMEWDKLEELLKTAGKDEVYRIKGIINGDNRWILNWAFGRWTWQETEKNDKEPAVRLSVFTAPYESAKWMKRIAGIGDLQITRVQ
ncbi:cobW-domain-containing protein [Piedraia hortae CBS 480.64]|uniref:CobW-domain-containing protein n=1 Tax=Piedraia hortae CBS 480.64 TaxID=1314780 RepID=A0A6A7C836_9PEZI|nr:cobW-domain-containing protein [Piedraia hortae CBS 480.64]